LYAPLLKSNRIWNHQAMLEYSPQTRTAKGIAAKWLKHQGGTMGDAH
jgi:hypothetical protein